jgi:hypothetical protein
LIGFSGNLAHAGKPVNTRPRPPATTLRRRSRGLERMVDVVMPLLLFVGVF